MEMAVHTGGIGLNRSGGPKQQGDDTTGKGLRGSHQSTLQQKMAAGNPTAGLVIATLNTLQTLRIGAPPGFDLKAASSAYMLWGAKGTTIRQAAQTLQHLPGDQQLMGSAHRIIRQLIPLQHRLLSKPITQELLRSQRRCFVGINTGAMLSDQNGVIKTSAAVPEQHQTVTAIAPEKSELGIGPGPGGNGK